MDPATDCLPALSRGGTLSPDETDAAIGAMLDGAVPEAVTAAFLTAIRVRGETPDELEGAVRAVRSRMTAWHSPIPPDRLLDTCGTGGDGASTVNLSTAAAIVVAACGVPVVKHGNRAASGNSGSSDVLTALGVAADPGPEAAARGLAELNIAFLFAPRFHPGLREVAPVRRQLPFRTLFNLVGPLCNPGSPGYQLVGTTDEGRVRLIAAVLARMPHVRRAAVVTGSDGLDEVTLDGPTRILVIESGTIRELSWTPEEFGLARQGAAGLRVDGPEDSADRIRRTLAGEPGPVRDYLLANAAAALWVVDPGPLSDRVARAAGAIDGGTAERLLVRWVSSGKG
jgi:anthranilate phosphoribosyltransferase